MRIAYVVSAVLVCVASLAVLASPALASPLLVGSTILAAGEPDPIGGTLIAGGVPVPFVTVDCYGTLTCSVIAGDTSNPWGGLTFTYLLVNNPGSAGELSRLTASGYAGFLTDSSFQTPAAGVEPTNNNRSFSGNVVGFSFTGAPDGHGVLLPGQTSALLVVQTNAPDWVPSFASVIDGGVASVSSFAPAVPEPATMGLLGLGLVGLFARRRRK